MGHLTAEAITEQRAIIHALHRAHADMLSRAKGNRAPIRETLIQILEARKLQQDDPFWALVDLFAILYERFGDRTEEVVSGAIGITSHRIKLDEKFLEYLPLLAQTSDQIQGAATTTRIEIEEIRNELQLHREELSTFIKGVAVVFKEFEKASQRVVSVGENVIITRVIIPLAALLCGMGAAWVLFHRFNF